MAKTKIENKDELVRSPINNNFFVWLILLGLPALLLFMVYGKLSAPAGGLYNNPPVVLPGQ